LFENPVTVHASCVQIAVRTLNESWAIRAIRNGPIELWRIAAAPTVASGEPSIVTETVRPLTVPDTEGSGGAVDDGDDGPPHAARPLAATREAT
jgi:hypothetical protein